MDIKKTVSKILEAKVNVSNVKETDSLTTLGLDSLDLVEIMLQIEDEFHIEFSSDEIVNLSTVQDVLDIIEKKLK